MYKIKYNIYIRTPSRLTFSFAVLKAAHYYITHVQCTMYECNISWQIKILIL